MRLSLKSQKKLIAQHGEKAALVEWDEIYHGQAQAYMMMFGMTCHYLTVTIPWRSRPHQRQNRSQ